MFGASQVVPEPDRAAPGTVQPDGESFVVQLQERVIASLGPKARGSIIAAARAPGRATHRAVPAESGGIPPSARH